MNQSQVRWYWFLVLTVFHLSSTHVSCQPEVDDHLIYKRAPQMGFQGMRGKKDTSEDQSSEGGNVLLHNSDFDKRVPGMGFQGMRGKKLYEYTEYDPIKRAPMMGFQGVRGKKDMEILNSGDIPYDKRIPGGNGFHGMRGKKDSDELNYFNLEHYLNDVNAMSEEKRVPSDGFFGMRGKKAPSFGSGFFGMRGKKYPYEFRGKFVGVRGKKMFSDNEIGDDEDILASVLRDEEYKGKPIDFNQLMSLLAENTEHNDILWEKRRGPQGFFGMRGKRSVK